MSMERPWLHVESEADPLCALFGYFLLRKRKYLARRCENRQSKVPVGTPGKKDGPLVPFGRRRKELALRRNLRNALPGETGTPPSGERPASLIPKNQV